MKSSIVGFALLLVSAQAKLFDLRGPLFSDRLKQKTVGTVSKLRLIDTSTNQAIATFDPLDGTRPIDLSSLPTTTFSIEAITTGSVTSVRFQHGSSVRTEDEAQWAMCGNDNAKFFTCPELVEGFNDVITATPFLVKNGRSTSGTPYAVGVRIIRSRPPVPAPQLPPTKSKSSAITLNLINADTDTKIGPMTPGMTIDITKTPRINFRADIARSGSTGVASVRFTYDGPSFKIENTAPFAFAGNKGKDYLPFTPTVGCHVVTASAFSKRRAKGTILSSLSVTFCAVGAAGNPPVGTPIATPVKSPIASPITGPNAPSVKGPIAVPITGPISPPATSPGAAPINIPIQGPISSPLKSPTIQPVRGPTVAPIKSPVTADSPIAPTGTSPQVAPATTPVTSPLKSPTTQPVKGPTVAPLRSPISPIAPTAPSPQVAPATTPIASPLKSPTAQPVKGPTAAPVNGPSAPITPTFTSPIAPPAKSPTTVPVKGPIAPTAPSPQVAPATIPVPSPLNSPTTQPVKGPTVAPLNGPSVPITQPVSSPIASPAKSPTTAPAKGPSASPVASPQVAPATTPVASPKGPTMQPVKGPTAAPLNGPITPIAHPAKSPTVSPTKKPTSQPSAMPSTRPSLRPSAQPSTKPSTRPSSRPSSRPSTKPSQKPSAKPSKMPANPGPYIHDVQGSGSSVVGAGVQITVTGIATSVITASDVLDGFFLQEEDSDADANTQTSEGIFVYCRGKCTPSNVSPGDKIRVTGIPSEFSSSSQIDATGAASSYAIISSNNPLPTPVVVDLPAIGSTKVKGTFERFEGMLVTVPKTLVVSEYYQLSRYGEIVLTETSRPNQFTHLNTPSVTGYASFLSTLATRTIILDDDSNDQNDAISGPNSNEVYFYPEGGLSLTNKFRGGDTIVGLTGVLSYAFSTWRIRPIPQFYNYTFQPANPTPAMPAPVGGNFKVSCFNVLNYFTTLDIGSAMCGPVGGLDCRGANSNAEFIRQRIKIVKALVKLDADIFGIVELENAATDGPLLDLVNALNTELGSSVYQHIPTGPIGTDAIRVGLIYKTASVAPYNPYKIMDSSINPLFVDTRNRPSLIQTFQTTATGARLTIAVNHLKSKGSACSGDSDVNDGQGNCRNTRKNAAIALASYLATDPTGSNDTDFMIIGDLNAYAKEDAITSLESAGYVNLVHAFAGPTSYSYVFDGQLGYLDHALATPSLAAQVTGVTEWHINADEVPIFDYNDEILNAGESSFERESAAAGFQLYNADPFRSSDHDPVLVGLNLAPTPAKSPTNMPNSSPAQAPAAPVKAPVAPVSSPVSSAPSSFPSRSPVKSPVAPQQSPVVPAIGDIVINEIMKDPNVVTDANGEWFELYNKGTSSVNLQGWVVKDLGTNAFTINSTLIVQPNSYVVLGRNSNTATNGGVTLQFNYNGNIFALGNDDDEIILVDNLGREQDRVAYDFGNTRQFPDPTGASLALKSPSQDNSVGSNWCTATTSYGAGDKGTPGGQNDCQTQTAHPSSFPSKIPSRSPSVRPSSRPSQTPSRSPNKLPSSTPSRAPSTSPTKQPSSPPSKSPSRSPSSIPSGSPSKAPSLRPSSRPSSLPSKTPSRTPSKSPSSKPSNKPSQFPSRMPVKAPVKAPVASPPVAPSIGDIVINEIMKDPNVVIDNNGEWFELYNKGTSSVNLTGWIVKDLGTNTFTINSTLIMQPNTYAVLGRNSVFATNGGVTLQFNYNGNVFALGNDADEIILIDTLGREQDRVAYDFGNTRQFPDPVGASLALKNPSLDNSVGAHWCTATTSFGAGDKGTPGGPNDCPP